MIEAYWWYCWFNGIGVLLTLFATGQLRRLDPN